MTHVSISNFKSISVSEEGCEVEYMIALDVQVF